MIERDMSDSKENQAMVGERSTFRDEVSEVLSRLRSGFAEIIAAVPSDVAKGADLHRALRIDRKLSWKVFKVASAINPVSVGPHVPTQANMNTFLSAAKKRGVPQQLIDVATRAAQDFEEVVSSHAGDRATFDSMVSALSDDDNAEQIDLVHRRLAFRGQRHILGVQARTQVKMVAWQPNDDNPRQLDALRVLGYIGLRRLRGDAPLVLSHSGVLDDTGAPMAHSREPLGPISEPNGMALLAEFCSKPLPEFRGVAAEAGVIRGELVTHDVGNRAAIDCIEGMVSRAVVPRYRDEKNTEGANLLAVKIPCEVLVSDMLVRKDTYGPLQLRAESFNSDGADLWKPAVREQCRLMMKTTVHYLGRGASVLHTPDVPRYADLCRYAFERAGWNSDQFDVYRCRIEYPVMPSTVASRFDLPAAPED